ncbi:AbrB family transcriptional regulator [Paenibacillus abyssi]|uniref:Monooxygenase n=1 Tax=Paenibacillus abyssi TaxID=1340531 RepID=A0A917FNZ5_9BACL|nr:AbrB family transcriptional regulator [Paenibacillus abyssi]GGF95083.1 monooxygenase [Paenibacillus abyssi]
MNYNKFILTFLIGLAGGGLFHAAHLPLPWILGPAFAAMVLNALRPGTIEWPDWIGYAGIVVVAYLLGQSMTLETVIMMLHDLPWMLTAAALWVAVCLLVGWGFARAARIDIATAMLGCVPGGLTQMVLIADHFKQADPGTVAIMQTSRLIVVLYTVPFLATWIAAPAEAMQAAAAASAGAGSILNEAAASQWPPFLGWLLMPLVPLSAWITRRLGLPAGEFLGPVLVVGALAIMGNPWPDVPGPLLAAAQLLIGIFIGKRVQLRMIWINKRLGPLSLATACLLVAITAGASWLISTWTVPTIVTWFLALAPGGLGEVAVTALLLGADVSQVTAYQLTRLFFVLLVAPPIVRLAIGRLTRLSSSG